jgi:stress response protein SCP2
MMGKLYRHNGEWGTHAIDKNASGAVFDDRMSLFTPHL